MGNLLFHPGTSFLNQKNNLVNLKFATHNTDWINLPLLAVIDYRLRKAEDEKRSHDLLAWISIKTDFQSKVFLLVIVFGRTVVV
jgi:hypothetical protein